MRSNTVGWPQAVMVLALGVCAAAQAQQPGWRLVAGAGLGEGGQTITSGTITNVSNNQVVPFQIKPGSGPQFRLGAEWPLSSNVAVQATVGHSAVAPMGFNGSLTFTTIPVEVLALASVGEQWRLGLGLRKAHAEMAGSGVAASSPVLGVYETSLGAVAEAQYLFATAGGRSSAQRSQFGISARYVSETYQRNGYSFNGNHYELGVVLYY
ncbi:MAG: hypothetical protein ACT4NV_05790 [Rhodoferax sp.]